MGDTVIWDGSETSVYTTADNWQANGPPVATDAVIFPDGNTVAVTGSGQNAAALLSFTTKAGYSGTIGTLTAGLPVPLELAATTYNFAGSGVSYFDLTANFTATCNVTGAAAGTPTTGSYGLSLSSADAISVLNINLASNQSVGVAALAGQTGEFTTINISGKGTVVIGSGVTSTTLNIRGSGTIYQRASIANVNVIEGTPKLYLQDATAISTALTIRAGDVYEQSSGTKTSVVISEPAMVVCSLPGTRTWTACEVHGDGGLDDTAKTLGNIAVSDYGSGANIHLGTYKTITRGTI